MTVPATARRAGPYNGNGSTTSFSFSFKTFAAGDLLVTRMDALGIETTLVLNSDYSVTLNGDQDASPGGTITYPISGSALPSGQKLTIIGDLDYEQTTDLLGGGAFNARVIEDTFDRTVIQIQQLEERLDRALLVPINSTANVQLPNPEPNELIGWNSGGTALQNVAVADLATAVAYGTFRYDTFTGNGSTTQFTLSDDPATIGNLDVSISGVVQVPGTDYSLSSGVLVFTSAPGNGTTILARYGEAMTSAPGDAADISFHPAGTGAVTRTAQAKMRDVVSVKDFGAVGDGVTDDTVAIQAALDAYKSTDAYDPQNTVSIFFPQGTYRITASLLVYSGARLIGEGNRSQLKADAGLTTQIIELKRTVATDSINFVAIQNLGFYTRTTCWAIKVTAATATELFLRNLYFDSTYCVSAATYMQSCEFSDLYSTGPVEQVLLFGGNMNTIRNLVVEGTAGSSTEPTVRLKAHSAGNSTANLVDRILIENTGSVNKVPLKIEQCDNLSVSGYWMEVTNTNGNSVEVVNCNSIRFTDFYRGIQTGSKVYIATTKDVWFDVVDIDSQSQPLASFFTIDATSRVRISRIYCRDAQGMYPKSLIAKNVVIDYIYNRTSPTVTGYQPVSQLSYQGGNIFVNPSFEAGLYGWNTTSLNGGTDTYFASNVANGLMMRLVWGAATAAYLYQNITVNAGQVGMPITFTAWVKNASGVGWAAPLSFGAGISATSGLNYTNGTDWQIITSTVVPQSAGTLSIGFYFEGMTDVYIDEASVYFGTVSRPNIAEFGSVQITNKTVLFATAAPTTGTWVVGSKVFNSAPAVGQPKGWVCTVAGTPGTWVSEGNL